MNLRPPRGAAAVVATTALALMAGCGGGDDKRDPLAKSDYIASADAICSDLEKQLSGLPAAETIEELTNRNRELIRHSNAALRRIRALQPPAELRPDVTRYLASVSKIVDLQNRQYEATARKRQAEAIRLGKALADEGLRSRGLATKIGYDVCGVS